MKREEQDKLWAELSEESRENIRQNYQDEKDCDSENEVDYDAGFSRGTASTLEDVFGKHNLKPILTYEDVAMELFKDSTLPADFCKSEYTFVTYPFNCTSEKHVKKFAALNRLLNVAKFLNKNEDGSDWVPNWKDEFEQKWYPCIRGNKILRDCTIIDNHSIVYFRTTELARQAFQILGADVIRTALTTEY